MRIFDRDKSVKGLGCISETDRKHTYYVQMFYVFLVCLVRYKVVAHRVLCSSCIQFRRFSNFFQVPFDDIAENELILTYQNIPASFRFHSTSSLRMNPSSYWSWPTRDVDQRLSERCSTRTHKCSTRLNLSTHSTLRSMAPDMDGMFHLTSPASGMDHRGILKSSRWADGNLI